MTRTEVTDIDSKLLVPVVVVLTFIGIINALQAFYVFYSGAHSADNFIRFLVSNLFYSWYFVIPALAVRWLSTRLFLRRESLPGWILIHLFTLIFLTVIHQGAYLEVDRIVLGSRQSDTIFTVLFNNPGVWGDLVAYVLFLLGFYMLDFRRKNQENEIEYSQLEMELVESRLHELRGRIHPGFLFNTLNEIARLVRGKENRQADHVLSLLSEFLRVTVYDNDREFCTIDEEMSFLENYLAIEKMRFAGTLRARVDVGENIRDALVPNFIFQPIVENLVIQKLDNSSRPCEIHVVIGRKEDKVILTVKSRANHAVPGNPAEGYDEILNITRQRLESLYPGENQFDVGMESGEWNVVSIALPFRISEGDPDTAEEVRS